MKLTREQAYKELDELYASLPAVACKGLCHDSCTTTLASELENDRIEQHHGFRLPRYIGPETFEKLRDRGRMPQCPALRADKRCSVYTLRPLLCRGFGTVANPDFTQVQHLLCEHECMPDGYVRLEDFLKALKQIEILSQEITGRRTPSPR